MKVEVWGISAVQCRYFEQVFLPQDSLSRQPYYTPSLLVVFSQERNKKLFSEMTVPGKLASRIWDGVIKEEQATRRIMVQ